MIVVPRMDQAQIAPAPTPNVSGGPQVSAEGFGANIGQAIQQFGGVLGEIHQREQEKANVAAINQARIALADKEASYFDPNNENGLYSYKGQDALKAPGALGSDLADFAQKYRQQLSNPIQQQAFDQLYSEHRLGLLDRVNTYALNEHDKFQTQAFQGSLETSLNAATKFAQGGDMEGAQQAQADGIASIQSYGKANGWAPEYTKAATDKFVDGVQRATEAANLANVDAAILQNPQGVFDAASARLQLGQHSPDAQAYAGEANAPRGVRNNNPGNLRKTEIQWQGKAAGTDPAYETFVSPEAGIRALALNAKHLQANGAQSVSDLVSQWAPRSENDTAAYIADVAKSMGVSPDAPVDLNNPATLTSFTNAIISHENGGNPYSPDTVQAGVTAALGKSKVAGHAPVTMNGSGMIVPGDGVSTPIGQLRNSGNFQVDMLKPDQLVAVYNRARDELNKRQVNMRSSIEQRVVDDTAAYKNGQSVAQPLTLAEFTSAYGDTEGMQKYGAYQAAQQLGSDLKLVNTLTPQQMQDLAKARAPSPGENYAAKAQDESSLLSAMQQTIKAREKDPVLWAMNTGIGNIQTLDLSDPNKLASSIATRVGPMRTAAQTYGMPYRLLSATERSALSGGLNGMQPGDKAKFFGALSTSLNPDDYQRVMADIQGDSPVSAFAGRIIGNNHAAQVGTTGSLWWKTPTTLSADDVAETMLRGEALINPPAVNKSDKDAPQFSKPGKFAMPSDSAGTGLRSIWSETVGDAYRGNGQAEAQAYQAFRAMYAGLAAKQGKNDGTLDEGIAQEAAKATIGNILDWNGHKVIPPYGMAENAFTDAANKQWQAIRTNVPGADGQDLDGYNLDQLGPNTYAVSNGGAPLRDKSGHPVVIRINPGAP